MYLRQKYTFPCAETYENMQCFLNLFSVTELFELCACKHLQMCVFSCWTVCTFRRARCLFRYTPECLCRPCAALASPCGCVWSTRYPEPLAAICCLLWLLIQRLLSRPITVLWSPWPMTHTSLCLLGDRVETEWPRLFVYLFHTVSNYVHSPYSTLPMFFELH